MIGCARVLIVWALMAFGAPTLAAGDLYRAKTIVTGQREETRIPGFAKCLEDVLVKVSGDPSLLRDAKMAAVLARARDFVSEYRYRDRLEGLPIHDEQGSRDRPYDLTVDFVPEKVDHALRALGRTPWLEPRPTLIILIGVQNDATKYILASDGRYGIDQRESLAAAAWQMGMPFLLLSEAALKDAGLSFATLPLAQSQELGKLAGADALPLLGHLVWHKRTLGWVAEWRLEWQGKTHRWRIKDVNFDDAFRNAMRGAIQIVSGNGSPQ